MRVQATINIDGWPIKGWRGTVVACEDQTIIGVNFDNEYQMFHSLNGRTEDEHGYWVGADHIKPINNKVEWL